MAKVLLVEDDNNLREIYEARLAAEGYEISTAKDGEDALAVAKQVKPDLIISDVMMPRISGFEMLDILRNTDGLKHAKVIMLTALGQAEDKGRADSLGADRYLVKSQVTLEDIVKAADELLNPDAHPTEDNAVATPPSIETSTADTLSPIASPDVAAAAHQPETVAPAPAIPPANASGLNDNSEAPVAVAPDVTVQPAPTPDPSIQATSPAPVASDPVVPAPNDTVASDPTAVTPAPSVQPAPVDPAPAPVDTAQQEEPLIQMPSQPVGTEVATATAGQVQSTSQENAAVAEQIENFVSNTPAITPVTQSEEPAAASSADAPAPASQDASTEHNDDVIKTAMGNLAADSQAPTPSPAEPVVPSTDTAEEVIAAPPETTTEEQSVSQISGKKIITPLNNPDTDKNDLQTLLAQEQMKENLEQGVTSTPVVGNAAAPVEPAEPPNEQPDSAPETAAPAPPPGGIFMPNENGSANENAL